MQANLCTHKDWVRGCVGGGWDDFARDGIADAMTMAAIFKTEKDSAKKSTEIGAEKFKGAENWTSASLSFQNKLFLKMVKRLVKLLQLYILLD